MGWCPYWRSGILEIIFRKTSDLIPYAKNSRTHSNDQILQIASSIKEFGFTNPVLIDSKCGIIAGHGRIMAARKLGIELIPTVELSHLTETQKRAYIIADNKMALNAGWDLDILRNEFEFFESVDFDTSLTGFSLDEIKINFAPGLEDDQGKLDQLEPKFISCPNCGKEFDVREN